MAPRLLPLALIALAAAGQGTKPKYIATDYPAHGKTGSLSIGAENWGHGISSSGDSIEIGDYIVIEVALYNERNKPFPLAAGNFTLRLNGKKPVLFPQSVGIVQSSVRNPGFENERELIATAGSANGDIVMGRRPNVERFPGDPRAQQQRLPTPVPPAPGDNSAEVRKPKVKADELVATTALVEGEAHPPVSGYLFYPYKGKLKSIKKLELLYEGPAGALSLVLE